MLVRCKRRPAIGAYVEEVKTGDILVVEGLLVYPRTGSRSETRYSVTLRWVTGPSQGEERTYKEGHFWLRTERYYKRLTKREFQSRIGAEQ